MKKNPPVLEGLGVALLVVVVVMTGLILASNENLSSQNTTQKKTETPQSLTSVEIRATPSEKPMLPTITPSATRCALPSGWVTYVMQSGDSLEKLARERNADLGEVMGANCLALPGALPGSTIFFPPRPATLTPTITSTPTITQTPTVTLRPCDYPTGWKRYNVNAGDTFFKLGVRFHISEVELAAGNCLTLDSKLHPGDVILILEPPTTTPTPRK